MRTAVLGALLERPKTDRLGDESEGVARTASRDSGSSLGHEESLIPCHGHDLVALARIRVKRLARRVMQRHQPRLSTFAPPDGQDTVVEIDIRPVECHGFTDAHARHHEQAEQRRIREALKTLGRSKFLRGVEDLFDLVVAVDVGS
jgi:hypothetical protein